MTPRFADHPRQIRSIVDAVRRATDPSACVRRTAKSIDAAPRRPAVIAVGKAALAMYAGWRDAMDEPARHFMVVPEGQEIGLQAPFAPMRAEHPLPGEKSLAAARSLAEFVAQCKGSGDVDGFVVLLSGGSSSLLTWPLEGLPLASLRALTQRLMHAGADIRQLNTVRKHLERLKGGRLAELMAPKPVLVLALSDVVGDDPGIIGSGPFSPDPSTFADAMRIVGAALGIEPSNPVPVPQVVVTPTAQIKTAGSPVPAAPKRARKKKSSPEPAPSTAPAATAVQEPAPPMAEPEDERVPPELRPALHVLRQGSRGELPETPKPGRQPLKHVRYVFVGSNTLALEAAKTQIEALGFSIAALKPGVTGAAGDTGRALAQAAIKLRAQNKASAILLGGETTVKVQDGSPLARGGRNQELALAGAIEIDASDSIVIGSLATDGVDGPTDAAGAFVTGRTCLRARSLGADAKTALAAHDSYGFFEKLEKAGQPHWIRTGPTGTNVNDLTFALVYPKGW